MISAAFCHTVIGCYKNDTQCSKTLRRVLNHQSAEALRQAGHKGNDNTVRKMAWRLAHDPIVLEALKEGAANRPNAMVPRAVEALEHIVADPNSRHHYKGIDGILNRTGLQEVKESKTTVVHKIDRADLITKIARMIERLGIAADPSNYSRNQKKNSNRRRRL